MQGFARLTPGPSENSCDRGPVAEVKAELHGSSCVVIRVCGWHGPRSQTICLYKQGMFPLPLQGE